MPKIFFWHIKLAALTPPPRRPVISSKFAFGQSIAKYPGENAKRFSDDASRDMRDLLESIQVLYVSVNQVPEAKLAGMIDDLKSKAAQFDINDIEASHTQVHNAAGAVGRQLGHAKIYKAASKFAHPTALLLCMEGAPGGLVDSFYGIGADCTLTCLRHIEQIIKNEYPDFPVDSCGSAMESQ
jgi:hypothetical protein